MRLEKGVGIKDVLKILIVFNNLNTISIINKTIKKIK